MICILGKSEAAITMILDNLESKSCFTPIIVVDNLRRPNKLPYENSLFDIREQSSIGSFIGDYIIGALNPMPKMVIHSLFGRRMEQYTNAIHKSAQISSTTTHGSGLIACSNSSVAAYTRIGNCVSINRNSSIGHHCMIGDFVSVSPSATICGNVTIGKGTLIGAGAVIIDGLTIGDNCVIGAGSVVTKDVLSNYLGYGNPFRHVRRVG